MRYLIRCLLSSTKLKFQTNPFDNLDFNSIKSMDKVLGILNSTNVNPPEEDERILLGKQIFEYKLTRYLNDKHIIGRDSRIWAGTKAKYKDFCRDSMEDYNNLTGCHDNENYLGLMSKFLINDLGTIQSLEPVMNKMINLKFDPQEYQLPSLKIPAAYSYQSNNHYLINKALNTNKDPLYLLLVLINDPHVIERVIHWYQIRNNIPISPYPMINSLMESQEYEGEILFNILVRRLIFREDSLRNDHIRNKFLLQPNRLKVIICHQSMILSRLLSFIDYKKSLSKVKPLNPVKLMVNNFHRFLASMFRFDRKFVLNWFSELMHYYNDHDHPINDDKLYTDALEYIDDLLKEDIPWIDFKRNETRKFIKYSRTRIQKKYSG